MGKSEIAQMPMQHKEGLKLCVYITCEGEKTIDNQLPEGMEIFPDQVAGHTNNGKSLALIKHKGTVLKPITNLKCGEREVNFYENLKNASDPTWLELREFVPQYYGTRSLCVGGQNVNCIVLEDVTKIFKKPCIMDVKIGRRTWDPYATYEKIMNEEKKYQECKRDLAFCIPGFQVYDITTNALRKYGKEVGKGLNKNSVPEVLRSFLNAGSLGFCRSLLVQFLVALWRIQHWARKQRQLKLFSSSLLLIYDAERLREFTSVKEIDEKPKIKLHHSTSLYRPLSLAVLNNSEKIPTGFSGQLTKDGPILKPPIKIKDLRNVSSNNNNNNVWNKSFRHLQRTHSFQNNYDKDMQSKRQDYSFILGELSRENQSELWATVKMIDFAHAFTDEQHGGDRNYLQGIDNLVKIFEGFLAECD